MAELIASGRIVDLALLLTGLEALLLIAYHRRTGRGLPPATLLINLLSGVSLMLALRAALAGAGWMWIASCLVVSLLAHLADLNRRWPRDPRG